MYKIYYKYVHNYLNYLFIKLDIIQYNSIIKV